MKKPLSIPRYKELLVCETLGPPFTYFVFRFPSMALGVRSVGFGEYMPSKPPVESPAVVLYKAKIGSFDLNNEIMGG